MKKLTQAVLVPFFAVVFILFFAGCPHDTPDVNESSRAAVMLTGEPLLQRDIRIFSNATIEDNFCDRSLIVILDNFAGSINRMHGENSLGVFKKERLFGTFERESVRDLTAVPSGIERFHEGEMLQADGFFRQIFEIRLPKESAGKEQVLSAIRELEQIEGILYAGPNFFYFPRRVPNDIHYFWQWSLHHHLGGIQAEDAWKITTGSRNVRVGIIDSGIAVHPDLEPNVDRSLGWNFSTNSNNTNNDWFGHGTHVAGIVGAVGNNGFIGDNTNWNSGITGVAWEVTLVPLVVSAGSAPALSSQVIEAITHSRRNNIRILNFSMGLYNHFDAGLYHAISNARNDLLFVCAAANSEIIANGGVDFPTMFTNDFWYNGRHFPGLPNVISVSSADITGNRSRGTHPFFQWSPDYCFHFVDIFAPGGTGLYGSSGFDILSTFPPALCGPNGQNCFGNPYHLAGDTGYHFDFGTSMAAPHVAGVAALMLSVNPDLTPSQIKRIILDNVDPFPLESTSGGRLNAYRAVRAAVPAVPITLRNIQGITVPRAGAVPVRTITGTDQFTGTVTWSPEPVNGVFSAGRQYTARINLTARPGFTFQGVPANFFWVAGATSVTYAAGSGVVIAVFPAAATTISNNLIQGVTAPVRDGIPVNSIIATNQFTGTVQWWPSAPVFLPFEEYTAIINLTPRPGFTFQGVPANFFEVSGAVSVTNDANSGRVEAVFSVFGCQTCCDRFGGGTGTAYDPYLIRTIHHLRNIAYANDRHFRLADRLDYYRVSWQPIPAFHGHLDGNGQTISGLEIIHPARLLGLFARNYGRIENLTFRGNIRGSGITDYAGAFAAVNHGVIENSISMAFFGNMRVPMITGSRTAGGIAGYNAAGGVISSSVNNGDVTGTSIAGGIAGRNSGTVTFQSFPILLLDAMRNFGITPNADNHGAIQSPNIAGGIVGHNTGMVAPKANLGRIDSRNIAGGIVGRNIGRMFECCCEVGDVWEIIHGGGSNIGGIISNSVNHGAIDYTFNGSVNGRVGGVVGSFEGGVVFGSQSWGLIRYTGPASNSTFLQPSMANIVGYFQSVHRGNDSWARGHLGGSSWGWLRGNVNPGALRWIPHPVNHDQARFVSDHEVGGTTRSRQVLFSAGEMMRGVDIDEWLSEYFSRIGTRLIWHEGEDQPRFPERSNERVRFQPDIR